MTKKQTWVLLVFFVFLIVLLRLPSYALPLDPDSGANAFFARQMLRGETLYGKFHPGHHLPGIYYTFELAFKLFSDNALSPKLLLIPWTLACVWLIYRLGQTTYDGWVGILGAAFFILVASQLWMAGLTVEMEHFANLPLIAAVYLATWLARRPFKPWHYLWVGILGAIGVLYKIIFVAPLIMAGLSILGLGWIQRKESGFWKSIVLGLIWLIIGFLLPIGIVAGYFASLGLWNRLLLIFKFGEMYFNDAQLMGAAELPRPFGFPLFWMAVNNIALLIFGLLGVYRLMRRSLVLRNPENLTDLGLVIWLLASMALAGLRGGGLPHYLLPVLPPLALLAAVEICAGFKLWKEKSGSKYAILISSCFVFLIVVNFIWGNYDIYRNYVSYQLGYSTHTDFLLSFSQDGYESQNVADYIKSHTTPKDSIYVWSIYMTIYYYADRLPPIEILWPAFVSATGSPERIFNPNTKYIALDTPERYPRPQWLMDGLAANYVLETKVNQWELYRRKSH